MQRVDVAIIGAGPAGSSCAAFCAAAGLRTILFERQKFPREKICGDCLNPACWPILRRLDVADRVRKSPHGKLRTVDFVAIGGRRVRIDLPAGEDGEIAIKRSLFDALLMTRARECGTDVREETTVNRIEKNSAGFWTIHSNAGVFQASVLVGADGRNSTVAHALNLQPRPQRERVALQTHIPLPENFGDRVVLQFLEQGYSGQAPVNQNELNLCLVSTPNRIDALKRWAITQFDFSSDHPWRTITPLTRAPISPMQETLFLIGDAARVVEPFTGEGIYYALRSSELAAEAIAKIIRGEDRAAAMRDFCRDHTQMYRGRLWINRLARTAVLSPRIASFFVHLARFQPSILRLLTARITQ